MKEQNNEQIILSLVRSGNFEIDEQGAIWRLKGGKNLTRHNKNKITPRKRAERHLPNGYLQIRTLMNGKRYHCYAHRIIWIYFNGNISAGLQVNHINSIKNDNRLSNLELVTSSENKKHASLHLKCWNGEKNGMSKLTIQQVLEIRKMHKEGVKSKKISTLFGMSNGHINDIITGRCWKHILP